MTINIVVEKNVIVSSLARQSEFHIFTAFQSKKLQLLLHI